MEYYKTIKIEDADGMNVLRKTFPEAKADEKNFVLFSTGGIHGHHTSIEDSETEETKEPLTFLIIKPRIVQTSYGNCQPITPDDFQFLKKLRKSSREAIKGY